MTEIQETTCTQITKFLPNALGHAITTYQRFVECFDKNPEEKPEDGNHLDDAKIFKARHDACKVAIAHIELLLKLADKVMKEGGAGRDEGDELSQIALIAMIENAAAEVERYKE